MTSDTSVSPLVRMRGVSKAFGAVQALRAVDLDIRPGEVQVLAGENGAGKTSLMNVLCGIYQADAGTIEIGGRPVRIASPRAGVTLGIGMVHQHFQLVGPLSALDNILLGNEGPGLRLSRASRRHALSAVAGRYGLSLDLERPVADLPVGVQQKVEILRALDRQVRVLILDEPTTHLTPQEVDALFRVIRQLAAGGTSVVLITHKVGEMLAIGDRLSVMRRGSLVATLNRAEASRAQLVALLMGDRTPESVFAVSAMAADSENVLEVQDLTTHGRGLRLIDCSLAVRAGELVGVAGVAGNGQRELAEAIMALRPADGIVRIAGRVSPARVRDRIRAGVAYIPEDRMGEGLLPRAPLTESVYLGLHQVLQGRRLRLRWGPVRALARTIIDQYRVSAASEWVPSAHLSGGNIQKLLVARAVLLAEAIDGAVLVAMNPTRGLDVATAAFVHSRLQQLRATGRGVLLISEDLDELMALCDRLLVLYQGRLAGEFRRGDYDAYRIGALMAGA